MDSNKTPKKTSRRTFLRYGASSTVGAATLVALGGMPALADGLAQATATVTPAPSPTPIPLPEGAAGKLTVIHKTEYFQDVQTLFREAVTGYAKANGVQLDISTANPEQFGDFMAKMQAAVQAGAPPDMSYHQLSVPQLYALDLVEDVSDVVAEATKLYGDIVPRIAEKFAKRDGKWWSIPFMSYSSAWFARKDVFSAAGIDVQTLDTWDKRREAALKVSNPDKKIWGWGMTINKSGDGHGLIMDIIQSFGGSITDKEGKKVQFNSPETVAAVNWLKETYTSDKYKPMLPPGIESWTDTSNNEAYLAGTVALTLNAFSIYAKAKNDKNPVYENTAVLHKPKDKDGNILESGSTGWISIFKGSKNVDAAKKLIMHMLDPKTFNPMVELGGGLFLPAYQNFWTDDILKIDPNFAILKEIMFNKVVYTGTAYPADPSAAIDGVLSTAIPSQMMTNVTTGKMSAEEAVKDAHDKIVQLFEESGIPQG
jgi:multiple sugar transport system substrate-binding protein